MKDNDTPEVKQPEEVYLAINDPDLEHSHRANAHWSVKYLLADTSISKADHDKTIAMMNFILLEKDKLYKAQLVELQKQLIDLLENKPFSFNTDTIKEVFKEVV